MLDIKYVLGEDWEGIYINDWLKIEGHDVSTFQAIYIVASYMKEFNDFKIKVLTVNQEWLEDQGSFPIAFENIPKESVMELMDL